MRRILSKLLLAAVPIVVLGLGGCGITHYGISGPEGRGYSQGWDDAARGGFSKTHAEDGGYQSESDIRAFRRGYDQGWQAYVARSRGAEDRASGGD